VLLTATLNIGDGVGNSGLAISPDGSAMGGEPTSCPWTAAT